MVVKVWHRVGYLKGIDKELEDIDKTLGKQDLELASLERLNTRIDELLDKASSEGATSSTQAVQPK